LKCPVIQLATNYRSHRAIVERYDRWMASADWSNPAGASFRFDKSIEADPNGGHRDYPAVISIWGRDRRNEAILRACRVPEAQRGTFVFAWTSRPTAAASRLSEHNEKEVGDVFCAELVHDVHTMKFHGAGTQTKSCGGLLAGGTSNDLG
jgi:hypothetical protein